MEALNDLLERMKRDRPELAQIISKPMTEQEAAQHKCNSINNDVEGNLNASDGYDCPECKNRGYVMVVCEERGTYYEAARRCKCMTVREFIGRMKKSGLGSVITNYTMDKYITDTPWRQIVKDKAVRFLKDQTARVFFIGGQSGAGKTHICTAISGTLLKRGKRVNYMLWMNESKELKGIINDPDYTRRMMELETVDVLYIDDFLKTPDGEPPSKGDLNIAIELINSRYMAKDKITILSSEWTVDDIVDFDEALGGRIVEMCGDEYEINIAKDRSKNYRLRGRTTL